MLIRDVNGFTLKYRSWDELTTNEQNEILNSRLKIWAKDPDNYWRFDDDNPYVSMRGWKMTHRSPNDRFVEYEHT